MRNLVMSWGFWFVGFLLALVPGTLGFILLIEYESFTPVVASLLVASGLGITLLIVQEQVVRGYTREMVFIVWESLGVTRLLNGWQLYVARGTNPPLDPDQVQLCLGILENEGLVTSEDEPHTCKYGGHPLSLKRYSLTEKGRDAVRQTAREVARRT